MQKLRVLQDIPIDIKVAGVFGKSSSVGVLKAGTIIPVECVKDVGGEVYRVR